MTAARILIIEDERIVAEDLRFTLEQLGYTVAGSVATGEEAVEQAKTLAPDIILMDIFLAGTMDGIAAAETIRASADIPVIFLTAFVDPKIMEKAKITQPYGYILKPYEERELHTVIEIALYKHSADRQLRTMNEELERRVLERTVALNDQVRFLQQLIDTIPSPVFYKDRSMKYLGCNRVFESYVGLPKDAIIGKTVDEILPPDIARLTHEKDEYLLSHEGIQVYQLRFPHPDKSVRDMLMRKATFGGNGTVPAGIIGVMVDITDRIRMEEALRESEKRFRAVVQDQSELIYRFRVDRVVLFANRAFLEFFRREEKDTVGYIYRLPVHPEDADAVAAHFASLVPARPSGMIEYRCLGPGGKVLWLQWNNRAFFDSSGNVTEYQSVGRDITRKKEIEEEQQRSYRQIEENLQQFATLNDHIRNPLSVIAMIAGLKDDTESRRITEKVREIDEILGRLHKGYVESEKVRMFLRIHYDIGS
ncbi:PAS domain S-box protein [Methanoregula sp. PtaB.Bin085]|uniref:PAS domain S-box protein n=1 Tax=Methanoregula sp. PtaB.Bin085 TaxID=1811680 RepID=UPI0009CA9B99|nr:PAS domain S-box protein [Methanoregula sp. PtaB.Bin085]OPX64451.1 MAG: aerobic respiration control sensor protein ArcB [Methanoregula sp. PtaB.Bin085]